VEEIEARDEEQQERFDFYLGEENWNPNTPNPEILQILRLKSLETEDPQSKGGLWSGFLRDFRSDKRLGSWRNFGVEKRLGSSPASEERERKNRDIKQIPACSRCPVDCPVDPEQTESSVSSVGRLVGRLDRYRELADISRSTGVRAGRPVLSEKQQTGSKKNFIENYNK